MLRLVTPYSANHFAGGVIMPNLVSSVDSEDCLLRYREHILSACRENTFVPYMTLFMRPYSRMELESMQPHIIGIKLYPAGITTQSENGVSDFQKIEETVSIMEELGIPLLIHGESSGFVMDREREFLSVYHTFAEKFPQLHIVMEHITTADAINFLDSFKNVSATVTLHHLMITLDDVIGDLMNPHLFCKPIAKTPNDLKALQDAVFSGHDKIMFGSDSAPHPIHKKECCGCAAGVFSAPIALPLLTELFEQAGRLDLLPAFVSGNAQKRYGIEPVKKLIHLEKKPFNVPQSYDGIVPFYAGKTISWSVC